MNFLIITFSIFAYLGAINCQYDLGFSNERVKSLRDVWRKEVLKSNVESLCPGAWNKYQNATAEAEACVNRINEDDETLCSSMEKYFKNGCFDPMVKFLEDCLPSQSKSIPRYIVETGKSIRSYVCQSDAQHILELYHPCIMQKNSRTERCSRLVMVKMQQYKSKYPSVSELCEFMKSMKSCIQSHIYASCGNPITRESFMNLFVPFLENCPNNKDISSENELK